ncbi:MULTISPECIES: hypothetical protein [Bacillaceae]|uniref:hypothetical protein n=1 Tax=Bacillaceae TaxID=186817 RepID=UPI001045A982|nr:MULTISPECIES: hypothetical protein [Bacillaceae]MDT2047292.1 hypothetical protein [Priestia flexa]TDB55043.1 hypothetical protein EPL02_02265 [Bacillus sp. CBEL-1]
MIKIEFIKLIRNNIVALIFGYIFCMALGINVLSFGFQHIQWVEQWMPWLTIFNVVILIDLLFWMAAMQISEDIDTNMIQVMRTSRSITQYFFSKHVLLLLIILIASFLAVIPRINEIEFVIQFLFLTLILSLVMISSGVLLAMIVKKQSIVMLVGSIVTGFIFAVMIRAILPLWNIDSIPFNPFEPFIKTYYYLYLTEGPAPSSYTGLFLFSIIFYVASIFIFKKLMFERGFRL